MIWEGWNLDYWAQHVTFTVKVNPQHWRYSGFYGDDEQQPEPLQRLLSCGDIIPDIPLHVRYKSFCDRLERKLLQH